MNRREISKKLEDFLSPISAEMGYELVYVDYLKENRNWILRVCIDKEQGVCLDDCEKVSKAIDNKLDEMNLLDTSYLLEVCSPGIDRPLIKEKDFIRFHGKKIKLKTREPFGNRRVFTGFIKGFTEGVLKLELSDKEDVFLIPIDKIQKANLVIEI